MMKWTAIAMTIALVFLVVGLDAGWLGVHSPRVLENEPMVDPIEVIGLDGDLIFLADARVIEIRTGSPESVRQAIAQSDFFVDIEGSGSLVSVHARKEREICGTPWAQPIRIPLFPETVFRNRRELIAFGECEKLE